MKKKWCVPCFLMLACFAGVQLYAQELDTNSVETIKIKAESGEAKSETVLGAIYEFGLRGVSKDVGEAMKWFRKAADQNFAPAQYEVGTCYANGQGVGKDKGEAVKWYLKAAEQNLAVAQYNLGVCYRDGEGVGKDEEEAVIWFRKAADQNLAIAQYNLGVCYDNGQGVGKDNLKAVKWYRKAAEQNLAYAQCNLGAHYEHGVGVPEDHVEAVSLYRKAAEQNYALAQYDLAVCYANGQGVAQDGLEAVKWYRRAAEQGNALAECNLGICYANGLGVTKDSAEAVRWFRKAANQNDSAAQSNLGVYYYHGYGVAKSEADAYFWFGLAAAQGDADALQSRDIIASHLSQGVIAEIRQRMASFVPVKENAETAGDINTNFKALLDQLPSGSVDWGGNLNAKDNRDKDIGTPASITDRRDYFTVGSTRDAVVAVQGEPTALNENYLTYGMSMVRLQDGKVVNWNNADVKLRAKYLTATNLIPKEYFTVGSTREEVLAIEGEPTTFNDNWLTYGMSMVRFQDGKVVNWNNADVKLRAKYLTATNLIPREYFTVGSTREEVLAIEGEPTTFDDNWLTYGMSMVMFKNGRVVSWNNADVKLRARYADTTNSTPQQIPVETVETAPPGNRPTILTENLTRTEYVAPQSIPSRSLSVQEPSQPEIHGMAFMDTFLGVTNFCIPSDNVISMKVNALKFQINGTTYDYSGHYAVMLTTPRKHKAPGFGFGTPEKAQLIIIDNFGGDTMPLPDATVWEKSSGFIDVEALGKEWIYSGTYTIQK